MGLTPVGGGVSCGQHMAISLQRWSSQTADAVLHPVMTCDHVIFFYQNAVRKKGYCVAPSYDQPQAVQSPAWAWLVGRSSQSSHEKQSGSQRPGFQGNWSFDGKTTISSGPIVCCNSHPSFYLVDFSRNKHFLHIFSLTNNMRITHAIIFTLWYLLQ